MDRAKRILAIPPHFADPEKMKIRLIEIAKGLSSMYKVYILSWHAPLEVKLGNRIQGCIADLFKRQKIYQKGGYTYVEFPMLHRPLFLVRFINSFFLMRFIKRNGINIVLSGQYYMFNIPEKRTFKYIFDVADIPAEGHATSFNRFIHRHAKKEAKKADLVTVVSEGLRAYIREKYKVDSYVIRNGAHIKRLRAAGGSDARAVRERYGLQHAWIIGYIGLLGSWVKVDMVMHAFREVKKEITNAALLLIGPSPRLNDIRLRYASQDIVITMLSSSG